MRSTHRIALLALCIAATGGCATARTLTEHQPGDPVFMSGTRLDWAAMRKDPIALKKFTAHPPAWPVLDLPFSFVADLFFMVVPRTWGTQPGTPGSGP